MKLKVKEHYTLHIDRFRIIGPGETVELSEEEGAKVLDSQGWKVEVVKPKVKATKPAPDPEPEQEAVEKPPKDRQVKKGKTRTK